MATRVTTTTEQDGSLAVTKTVLSGDRADRLAEARWLADAACDFVVSVLNVGGEPLTIKTKHHGQRTLRTAREDPPAMARLLVRVARGIADLHGRGFVHGKLTVDHVIVGTDGDVRVCSPSGVATDPVADMRDLGRIVVDLLQRWDDDGVDIANRAEWERIVERLTAADEHTSPHRIARWFAPLAVEPTTGPDRQPSEPRSPVSRPGAGVAVLAVFLLVVATARWTTQRSTTAPEAAATNEPSDLAGSIIEVDGRTYRFDRAGAAAAGTPTGCPAPRAAYLDEDDTVWLVGATERDGLNGAVAEPLARVPGATELTFEANGDSACTLWATGPAGRTAITVNP